MGCTNDGSIGINSNTRRFSQLIPYLQSRNDPNFNFPEVTEDIYVGLGLKKMKGYI